MTPRERVDAVFEGKRTDKVPICHISICSETASALLGREAYVGGGIQQWREVKALWEGKDAHQEYLERSFRDAIDIALLMGVIHHLSDADATQLLNLIRGLLAENGRLVSFDPCLSERQNPIARYLVSNDRGQFVRTPDSYQSLANGSFSVVRGRVVNQTWIPYTRWIMECRF